jgi:hypothetical protein
VRLPSVVRARVKIDGQGVPNILVWINLRIWGQDYFRALVGLTDTFGDAVATGDQINEDFRVNQRLSMMDFKTPIADCDEEVVIGVEGGRPFVEHQRTAIASGMVLPASKRVWALAQNGSIQSTMQIIQLAPDGSELSVVLDVSRA